MTIPSRDIAHAAALAGWRLLERRKAATPNVATRRLLVTRLTTARRLYAQAQSVTTRHKGILDGLPWLLRWLIGNLTEALRQLFDRLEAGDTTATQWANDVKNQLADYHLAAYMAGAKTADVADAALTTISEQVGVQVAYLDNFKAEIQNAADFQAGWNARAQSYAGAVKVPYWFGATAMLPLPAMPAQGTQCQNNCKCEWEIHWIDEKKLSADAKWVRHASDSCQTCLEREAQWSNIQIRDGVLL